jgi:hypothetical protein
LVRSSLEGGEEVNLIEIDVPLKLNPAIEEAITQTAYAIAGELSWLVDLR